MITSPTIWPVFRSSNAFLRRRSRSCPVPRCARTDIRRSVQGETDPHLPGAGTGCQRGCRAHCRFGGRSRPDVGLSPGLGRSPVTIGHQPLAASCEPAAEDNRQARETISGAHSRTVEDSRVLELRERTNKDSRPLFLLSPLGGDAALPVNIGIVIRVMCFVLLDKRINPVGVRNGTTFRKGRNLRPILADSRTGPAALSCNKRSFHLADKIAKAMTGDHLH